jgi:hypothetical protein
MKKSIKNPLTPPFSALGADGALGAAGAVGAAGAGCDILYIKINI